MKRKLIIITFSFFLLSCIVIIPGVGTGQPPVTENDLNADPDTAKNVSYMSKKEQDVVYFLNLARQDPKGFAEKYISPYRRTKDGEECYNVMQKTTPLPPLKPSKTLALAAQDHATDMGLKGKVGHTGTDGSSMQTRIGRHGKWLYTAGENCSYGSFDVKDIVVSLLIDEKVPGRGHRKNILNKEFRYVGIGIRTHKEYGTNCVQDFAGGVDK
ncbi:MAG: CAP domain-containing protein [Spirochaetales bacterium]|nr:CAP domain-containing protein [Spirochaetales bacterium]